MAGKGASRGVTVGGRTKGPVGRVNGSGFIRDSGPVYSGIRGASSKLEKEGCRDRVLLESNATDGVRLRNYGRK